MEETIMEKSLGSVIIEEDKLAFETDKNIGPVFKFEGKDGRYEVILGVANTPFVQQIVEKQETDKKVIGADGTAIGRFYADRQHNFLWVMSWNAEKFVCQLQTDDKKGGFLIPNNTMAEELLSNPAVRRILEEKGITDFWQEKNPGQNYVIRDVKMNKAFDLGKFQDSYGEYSAVVAVRKVS